MSDRAIKKKKRSGFAVLGVDPGLANLGIAVLEIFGTKRQQLRSLKAVQTKPPSKKRRLLQADSDAERLRFLLSEINRAIDRFDPIAVVYEAPTGGRSARGIRSLAYMIGALVAVCDQRDIPLMSVSPTDVKMSATGMRSASKDLMVASMKDRFPSPLWNGIAKSKIDHPADALACITCVLKSDVILATMRARC